MAASDQKPGRESVARHLCEIDGLPTIGQEIHIYGVRRMKKWLLLPTALAAALAVSACNTPQGQNAAGGALLGGATGAAIGAVASNGHASGALLGGAIGAATGAMIGSAATPAYYGPGPVPGPRCAEWYYDYYGNRVCRYYY